MGLNPASRSDGLRRQKRQNEDLRQLRKRPRGHAEAKNYIISGQITTDLYIPPVFFARDPDNTIPEVKLLYELVAVLRTGTCSISWDKNGSPLTGADQSVTTDPLDSLVTMPPPGEPVAHRDYFQPTVTAAAGASDLTLVLFLVTRQA